MPLFTDAYLGDTTHLSTLEHGAYLLLLIVAWRNGGHLPNDDKLLARYARLNGQQWARVRATLMEFFTVDGASIFQKKQRQTYEAVKQKHERHSEAGRRGGLVKPLKTNDLAEAGLEPSLSLGEATKTKTKEEERELRSPKKIASAWKEGVNPPQDWLDWAVGELGWSHMAALTEATKFIDYALAHRKTYADWKAGWRQWCRSPFQKSVAAGKERMTV